LVWKKLPTKTFTTASQKRVYGFKQSKERVTLHLCSNLSGSLLVKPMIFNRSLNPRAFNNICKEQLPVFWRANQKAWMTQKLFEDWFFNCFAPSVEDFMKEKNLFFKVLLIVDNASCHNADINHPNIKIIYFPPNCTPLIQPLDQGVIQTFKLHYTKKLFQNIFNRLEKDNKLTITQALEELNIVDCIKNVMSALTSIKSSTLNACWKPLLPEIVEETQEDPNNSLPIAEIVNIASKLSDEEFNITSQEVKEQVLEDQTLDMEGLIQIMYELDRNENEENLFDNQLKPGIDLKSVEEGLKLSEELKHFFLTNDQSTIRSGKFARELQTCLAPYKNLLKTFKKHGKSSSDCEENLGNEFSLFDDLNDL
jgi:hypothetical protein